MNMWPHGSSIERLWLVYDKWGRAKIIHKAYRPYVREVYENSKISWLFQIMESFKCHPKENHLFFHLTNIYFNHPLYSGYYCRHWRCSSEQNWPSFCSCKVYFLMGKLCIYIINYILIIINNNYMQLYIQII